MAKTKTKGTAKTVSDTPVPQPITISSTNPKIMADNIKKLEKAIKGADDASEISYDNTESHLTASNVQAAIDEVVSGLTPTASDVSYDNTDSGLTADDVQSAIDEVVSEKANTSNLVSVKAVYNSTSEQFEVPEGTPAPPTPDGAQIAVPIRNANNGAIYILRYNSVSGGFPIAAKISGNDPANDHYGLIQYISIS